MDLSLGIGVASLPAVGRDPLAFFADGGRALVGEAQGTALDFRRAGGGVAVRDITAPTNARAWAPFLDTDGSAWLANAGTSPKLIAKADGTIGWTDHNAVAASNDWQAAAWTNDNILVTAGQSDPSGGAGAYKLTNQGVSTSVLQNIALMEGARARATVYWKDGGLGTWLRVYLGSGSVWYGLASGTPVAGTTWANVIDETVTGLGGGWFQIDIDYTVGATKAIGLWIANGDGSTNELNGGALITWRVHVRYHTGAADNYLGTTTAARFAVPQRHDSNSRWFGLTEPQRTNLLATSADFDSAVVGPNGPGTTIAENDRAAPDGTLTADKITTDGQAGGGIAVLGNLSIGEAIASKSISVSLWVYAEEALPNAQIRVRGTGSTQEAENINTPVTTTGAWVRLEVVKTFTAAADGSSIRVFFYPDGLSGTTARVCWTWGFQIEIGGAASSDIPTFGASVTRAADAVSVALSKTPHSAMAGTIYVKGRTPKTAAAAVLVSIDDGTANERFRVEYTGTNIRAVITDGGSAVASLDLGAVAVDTAYQVSFAWAADDVAASLDGGAVVADSDTGGALPAVTTLRFGHSPAGERGIVEFDKLVAVPRRVSDGDLPTWRYAA